MLRCTLDRDKLESLNTLIKERNALSPLNRFSEKAYSAEDIGILSRMGMVDEEGTLLESIRPSIRILSEPYAVVRLTFTGGVGSYEHHVTYDRTLKNHVAFTVTPDSYSIDDETSPYSIVQLLQDFVGRSHLKSISLSYKFSRTEALVVASLLDMERRTKLRAFIDELPASRNAYHASMIWRIINSTNTSIQWFVSVMNEVIGAHITLSLQQVHNAIEQLMRQGILEQKGMQYQLTGDFARLSDRMIIIDNVLSIQVLRQDDQDNTICAGFTCIQAGVHDLLLLDSDGNDIVMETISSAKLLDYLEQFYNCESYFPRLQA